VRIAIQSQGAGWVIDQIKSDFQKLTRHKVVKLNENPDVCWCLNLFGFSSLLPQIPKGCISVVHAHHVDICGLNSYDFKAYNQAKVCVVPNQITEKIMHEKLSIPVCRLPYWVSTACMQPSDDKVVKELKDELGGGSIIIGSFQKDGNGTTGDTPKFTKNPDLFIDVVTKIAKKMPIKVILAGYARNYVIKNLLNEKIDFIYKPRFKSVFALYNVIDWYLVTSRYEGGPQAVLEAAYHKVNILSTPVGLAPEILHAECLCEDSKAFVEKFDVIDRRGENYKAIQNYLPEVVIPEWDDFFERL